MYCTYIYNCNNNLNNNKNVIHCSWFIPRRIFCGFMGGLFEFKKHVRIRIPFVCVIPAVLFTKQFVYLNLPKDDRKMNFRVQTKNKEQHAQFISPVD